MQPVAKLVKQIREALAGDGQNAPWETLAGDYARLCQEANQRLESCAAMLEKGSEYQALQLAETEPVLLDLIGTLSFAEAPDWAEYCLANQLPAPPRFDPKAVQALDRLYAKGISANHPLYKDYRAAVTSRDDAKAIQIIRSIVRLNPDDANAKSELARIENKLFQLKLQELRNALSQRDENVILDTLSELERLGTPARVAEVADYSKAVQVRRDAARREAIAATDRLIDSLDEERQAGAWRMVGDILARVRALQSEHGFQLTPEQGGRCAEMQQYFDAQRAAADEAARFQQAISTIGGLAESVDSRLLTRSSLTFEEAENLHAEFTRRWKEVEKFHRSVPDEIVRRVRTSAAALQTEVSRLQRQRRLKIMTVCAIALVVIGVAAWFTVAAVRAQDYASQLASLREAGQVEAAEKMTALIRSEQAALAAKPKLSARLDEIDRWTRDERTKSADIDARLTALESTAKAGMEDADPIDLATKLESVTQLVESTAAGLRAGPSARLLVVKNQFDAHVTILREKLIAQADSELTALEAVAGEKLSYDQSKEVITQALGQIEPPLKSLEGRVKPPVAALELPSSQQSRVSALRKRVNLFHDEIALLAKVYESILQAATLDAYLQALAGYKESRLTQASEVNDARKLLAAFPKLDSLLAGLLMPDDPVGWAAAKADATGEALAPDTVLPAEISKLVGLRDDRYVNDIWEVTLSDFRRKGQRELYSRGALRKEGPSDVGGAQTTRWSGEVYEPNSKSDIPAFMPTTYTATRTAYGVSGEAEVTATRLSSTSECLARLELNRMTDAQGTKFERPLLRAFDDLVADKSASPIFKAYLMQQLAVVLKVRPYAWGFEFCPSLRNDLNELDRLCDGNLRSYDWLLERKRAQLGSKLATFFTSLQGRNYLGEARLHREIVRRVSKAGLQFGGFLDSAGQAHLLGEARSPKSLWVLQPEGQRLIRYVASKAPGATPQAAGFSPVFFVPLDPTTLLAELTRTPGNKIKVPAIPWLEAQ